VCLSVTHPACTCLEKGWAHEKAMNLGATPESHTNKHIFEDLQTKPTKRSTKQKKETEKIKTHDLFCLRLFADR
jgi:hypothetical protein